VKVDTLMNELDELDEPDISDDLDVDVGLDDFDELDDERGSVDVDKDLGGYGSNLDIIRTYIDMDDEESARTAISEILEGDNEQAKVEAQELLKELDKE